MGKFGRALREAFVTVVVAVLVTAFIYGVGLRQQGADLSQRLLVANDSPLRFAPSRDGISRPPASWVFVDVDVQPCSPEVVPCDRSLRARQHMLARLLRAAREARPRVVAVDMVVGSGERASTLEPVLRDELNRAGPPVLLAWLPLPSMIEAQRRIVHLESADALPLQPTTFLSARFLPALISSRPTARELVPSACIQGPSGPPIVVPTLSYAAALIAAAPQGGFSLLDAVYGAEEGVGTPPTCDWLPRSPESQQFAQTERVFSARSLREQRFASEANYWPPAGNWLHFRVGTSGEIALPSEVIEDGVVVIGSAAPDAFDTHWTALGEIKGGEILLNDIRQFTLTSAKPSPGTWGNLAAKWPFFIAGFIAAFIMSLIVFWRERPQGDSGIRAAFGALGTSVLHLLGMLILTAAAFAAILWLMPHQLGSPPDFVTPYVALGAEGLFELAFQAILTLRLVIGLPRHLEHQ